MAHVFTAARSRSCWKRLSQTCFPSAGLTIDHSVSSGGYFCQVIGRPALTQQELISLEQHMRDLVDQDLPFERKQVPLSEAIEYFEKNGQMDKVQLLKYRTKDFMVLYRLGDMRDYHHGYMVPSTGYLQWFGLTPLGEGFILHYPAPVAPKQILPMPDYPTLLKTFRQYGNWLHRLGIESVGALNDAIMQGRAREIILVSEALHERQIAEIAERNCRALRSSPHHPHRGAFLFRQDHLFQTAGGAASGAGLVALRHRNG